MERRKLLLVDVWQDQIKEYVVVLEVKKMIVKVKRTHVIVIYKVNWANSDDQLWLGWWLESKGMAIDDLLSHLYNYYYDRREIQESQMIFHCSYIEFELSLRKILTNLI